MTEAELHELILISAEQIDASFEFWLTISFGVLVAVHVTKGAIGPRLKALICTLYVSASLVAILLTMGDKAQIAFYAEQLERPFPGFAVSASSDMIRMIVYVISTLSISIAIFRYGDWVQKRKDKDRDNSA